MRALITGVNGFVGTFLSKHLLDNDIEIVGVDKSTPANCLFKQYCADINDTEVMEKIISSVAPNHIYHLAAPAFIPDSYENPMGTFNAIITGTVNILEIVRKVSPYSKLLYVGSSEEFGVCDESDVFTETLLPKPCTPYGAAKLSASIICEQYARFYDVDVVRTRSFNHIGPGQSPRFVCASLASQIAKLERKEIQEITVGNLITSRDFLDVRDVVKAYRLVMENAPRGGLYNVCSGTAVQIKEVLRLLLSFSSFLIDDVVVERSDEQRRKFDNIMVHGDNSKLVLETGWYAEYSLQQTLLDTLNYWRGKP